jgi:hypothetical protein
MTSTAHLKTYVVGDRDSFVRYCREHMVLPDDPHVVHVARLKDIEHATEGGLMFLRHWDERLPTEDWRAILNHVIGKRAARRMAAGDVP